LCTQETYTSSLISYGEGYGIGDSAMAKTVGLPVAMAARLILDGQVKQNGVVVPTTPDYYEPILATLAQKGIHCIEKVTPAVC
jgi:alpha-aminoadipic semialdehyde synthase